MHYSYSKALLPFLGSVLLLSACTLSTDPTSADELIDLAAQEGRTLRLDVRVQYGRVQQNAASCAQFGMVQTEPCNNAQVGLDICSGEFCIPAWASDGYVPETVAIGEYPQPSSASYDGLLEGVPFGCAGNDLAVVCAPAIASRIEVVIGRVVRDRFEDGYHFEVDDVELSEGPRRADTPFGIVAIDVNQE